MLRRAGPLLVPLIVVAACGGGAETSTTTEATTTTVSSPTTQPTTTTIRETTTMATTTTGSSTTTSPTGGTEPALSSGFPGTGMPALLTDVDVESADDGAHVTFTFEGGVPEYRVEYVEPPVTQGASGEEVEIAGDAFLSVTMSAAAGVDLSGDDPRQTYTGPDEITPDDAGPVVELEKIEDFESVLSWAIGLSSRLPFTVQTRSNELVVTFQQS